MKQKYTHDDEQFARITAQYVMDCEEGKRPQIREYTQRYPRYADALVDFAAYYHTIEVPLSSTPTTSEQVHNREQSAQRAARKASRRVYASSPTQQPIVITTLLRTAENVPLTMGHLAAQLEVSQEIVEQLEHHAIEANSIPLKVARELALILHISISAIQQYFLMDERQQAILEKNIRVAEPIPTYPIAVKRSFLQTIEESVMMTEVQKRLWREIVAQEPQKERGKSSFYFSK